MCKFLSVAYRAISASVVRSISSCIGCFCFRLFKLRTGGLLFWISLSSTRVTVDALLQARGRPVRHFQHNRNDTWLLGSHSRRPHYAKRQQSVCLFVCSLKRDITANYEQRRVVEKPAGCLHPSKMSILGFRVWPGGVIVIESDL